MAYIQKDRVKETTTTTGTGAITLAGAVLGFQAFSAVMSVADTCYYVIVSATGTDWETGTGTYSAASVLTRTTVLSSSNSGNAVSFASGTKDVFMGPIAESVNDIAHGGTGATTAAGARTNLGVSTGTVTSVAGAGTVSGLTLTGTVTSSGSLTLGGSISTLNQSTTGNAATVTTNANLTGHVTSSGNAAVLGSFTSAQLATALSDETGTGAAVFATSPTLVTPLANALSAVPVASGAGNSLTIAAGSGIGTGSGANLILNPGEFATSGTRGNVVVDTIIVGKALNGIKNTIVSATGMPNNDGGHYNTLVGNNALYLNTSGRYNTAIGSHSMPINTSGYYNTGIGSYSFEKITTGNENCSIGVSSASRLTTGSFNTFLGNKTGLNASQLVSAVNSMALGYEAFTTASNQVVIGNTSVTQTVLRGYVNTTVFTVATLPAAATAGAGARAFVSDANATTFAAIVAGGGANGVPVYSDGTAWFIG